MRLKTADDYATGKKKRKRPINSPKLLVHDKVEVRSLDEGARGSWNSGVVISRINRAREVKYDFLFSDDGSKKLIENIDVHPVIDGITPIGRMRAFYRGLIRPLPPPFNFNKFSVNYGQCVDAYYQEAWWEGVVFDHENNAKFRFIFFPDNGDLLQIGVDNLRITQDWDELTEEWKPRGNWLFLDLIEKIKQENLVHVSVREIWYEVSGKHDFEKIKEWTNSSTKRDIWESLVMEVINDHSKLAAEMFFSEITDFILKKSDTVPLIGEEIHIPSAPSIDHNESYRLQDLSQTSQDSDSCLSDKTENNFDKCQIAGHDIDMVFEAEKSKMDEGKRPDMFSTSNSDTTHEENPFNAQLIVPSNGFEDLDIVSEDSPIDKRFKRKWEIAGIEFVPEAEFCPESVVKYLNRSKLNNCKESNLAMKLRKHLAYLGWKIEFSRDVDISKSRLRYTSPKGRSYMSLVTVCKDWNMAQNKMKNGKETKVCAPPPSSQVVVSSPPDIIEPANFPGVVKYFANLIKSGEEIKKRILSKTGTPKGLEKKAKRHLVASGWSIWTNEAGKLRYTSPSGKTYNSLAIACKAYKSGEVNYEVNTFQKKKNYEVKSASILKARKNKVSDEPNKILTGSERLPSKISSELVEYGHHKEGNNGNFPPLTSCNTLVQRKSKKSANSEKKEKKQKNSAKANDDEDDEYFVKCSKRPARKLDSSSSFGSPLTVLSWLIDNDVVLPRSKVYYFRKKENFPIKEGQITREGIKCNCCKNVFSLGKFQAHAGSIHENDRPAANIYLEDGRSLLSCQSQLRNRYQIKSIMTPSPHPKRRNTNDSICSVCHFGGLLVMCDHCPSSFHRECLGLKDIPDGEWFCPQCCCGICGNNKFIMGSKQNMQDSILDCHQCEHRYHVGCLVKQGDTNMDGYSEGKWFCDRNCKQIFLGLQKLLEKPVVVGDANLSWTLLKYIPRNGEIDGSDLEPSVETYSNLNLVVSVMHECFEPMNEPGTKKDIVEDVVFSRGSDLSRLNFQGFYTVILSKDDELITVASVRVHGKKVAEVPLVGTRFQYRKLGMCRFLMNELEKKLMELGVERIVMPSAPSVLNTWTASFGFSKITESERLSLRSYTFLDFQGAVMCQKILSVSAELIRTLQNARDGVGGTPDVNSDKRRNISKVFQAEKTKEANSMNQVTPNFASSAVASGVSGGNGMLPLVLRVDERFSEKRNQLTVLTEEGDESKESDNKKEFGVFRCYKRRRILQLAQ